MRISDWSSDVCSSDLIRRPQAIVIFWDVDAPATLDRIQSNPEDSLRKLVPDYDLVLTYGGGDPVVEAYQALGARYCVPVYNAPDPENHTPVPATPAFPAATHFLGKRLPDREDTDDTCFVAAAKTHPTA